MKKNETKTLKVEDKSVSTRHEQILKENESNNRNEKRSPTANGKTVTIDVPVKQEKEKQVIKGNLSTEKKSNLKKSDDHENIPSKNKNSLETLKKEELITKIKEFEEKLKAEKEEKKKLLETKNKEIESKEKTILTIASTNKKLMNELEDLKKEVDEKLDKMSVRQIRNQEMSQEKSKKGYAFEKVLKVREKELKNVMSLIEIYKKDKENLEKTLNEKSDYKQIVALQNKLKEEENRTIQLENEIKVYNRLKEEHNRCEQMKIDLVDEKTRMMTDMKYLRSKNREFQFKIKEEEEKISKLSDLLAATKANILLKTKDKIETKNNAAVNITPNIKPFNTSSNITLPVLNINPGGVKNSNTNLNSENVPPLLNGEKKNPVKKTKSEVRTKFSRSLHNKQFDTFNSNSDRHVLFPKEEKEIISKLLPQEQLEKIQMRFNAIDQSKFSLEKKFITETKGLTKKLLDAQERLELASIQTKEAEQKNKILSYQINEHKNENKIMRRKLTELKKNINNSHKTLADKEEEIKLLTAKIQSLMQMKTENGNNNSRSYIENPDEGDNQEEGGDDIENSERGDVNDDEEIENQEEDENDDGYDS